MPKEIIQCSKEMVAICVDDVFDDGTAQVSLE